MKAKCLFALLGLSAIGVAGAAQLSLSNPAHLNFVRKNVGNAAISPAGFSFGIPVRLTLARNSATNVAIGDANGDGRKDLALTSYAMWNASAWVSLFLQRADGSLSSSIDFAIPDGAYDTSPVAFLDLDHNGADEIIVGRERYGVTVLRVDESGALSSTDHVTRRGCKFLATGDLDSDGNIDLVCHNWKSTITLFYGDGVGGFASTAEVYSSAGNYNEDDFKSIQIADVTGDGLPDLLVTATSVNSFFVHTNNGFGGFWPATVYTHPWTSTGVWPAAIEVLDLDGDGVNEVVTASPDNRPDAALNIYRQGANGYLMLSSRVSIYDSTTALIAGDADGDGDADLLAGHYGFNTVTLLGANGGGMESQARFDLPGFGNDIVALPRQGHSNGIALGDLDGDGCNDLAGATYSGVTLLYGCRPFVSRLPVSDFDGDGVSDLLWRFEITGENYLWPWADLWGWHECVNEVARKTGMAVCPWPMDRGFQVEAIGDFDGDGNSDLFWRDRESGANQIWDRAFYPRVITGVTNQAWQAVGAGDFDGDDRSDLLWRNGRTGANAIWKSGNFATTQTVYGVTDLGWKIVGIGDFNGDGQSDILWRHSSSGRDAIWLSGRFETPRAMTAVTNLQWKVAGVGDFNGDGRDDVVWRNAATGGNAIWLSANSATSKAVTRVTNLDWDIAAVADYNGDGRSDLMWRNHVTGANAIWLAADSQQQQGVATTDLGLQAVR